MGRGMPDSYQDNSEVIGGWRDHRKHPVTRIWPKLLISEQKKYRKRRVGLFLGWGSWHASQCSLSGAGKVGDQHEQSPRGAKRSCAGKNQTRGNHKTNCSECTSMESRKFCFDFHKLRGLRSTLVTVCGWFLSHASEAQADSEWIIGLSMLRHTVRGTCFWLLFTWHKIFLIRN